MEIISEIIDYLGTKEARITIYGAILGMLVVFLVRRFVIILGAWKESVAKGGKKGFNNFLSWLGHKYYDCPPWLKAIARSLEKIFGYLGVKQKRKSNYRRRRRK